MPILRDVLSHDLDVVICGEAAGNDSFESGTYYADKRNRFWKILYATGLTPIKLLPSEFEQLPRYGIGLTNLVREEMHSDRVKRRKQIKRDEELKASFRSELKNKISEYAPRIIAFNGKGNAELFLGSKIAHYGLQPTLIGTSKIFVLESTSGSNASWNNGYSWYALVDFLRLHASTP
jgi:TDG/mug DNA glycosylase family protein